MKVLCINDYDKQHKRKCIFITYGECYDVIGEDKNYMGYECYELSGLPPTIDGGRLLEKALYLKSRFIPLSSIDETELIKERLQEV